MQKRRIHKIRGLLFSQILEEVSGENSLIKFKVITCIHCVIVFLKLESLFMICNDPNVQGHNGCIGKHGEYS